MRSKHDPLRFASTAAEKFQHRQEEQQEENPAVRGAQQTAEQAQRGSHAMSRWWQRQRRKAQYRQTQATAHKAGKKAKSWVENLAQWTRDHVQWAVMLVAVGGMAAAMASGFSSCSLLSTGGGNLLAATSYTAQDRDLLGAEQAYSRLEDGLRTQVEEVETHYPDYDEYRYEVDEVGHNPYQLASYLTARFGSYTQEGVQGTLEQLLEAQYRLSMEEQAETRTRTEERVGTIIHTDPETGETWEEEYRYEVDVVYVYRILQVTLTNHGLEQAMETVGLTPEEREQYEVLMTTLGNRPDLFDDVLFAVPDETCTDYEVPGEALTDTTFANMLQEAEKYLGWPYVWGGASPETSFDCSGFVSWVINQCGWDVGRLGVLRLYDYCTPVSKDQAKPGDLVFFENTYDAPLPGPTHVGIYVGDGMMIHAGNPISYASMETKYWQAHFYGFGRLP